MIAIIIIALLIAGILFWQLRSVDNGTPAETPKEVKKCDCGCNCAECGDSCPCTKPVDSCEVECYVEEAPEAEEALTEDVPTETKPEEAEAPKEEVKKKRKRYPKKKKK